MEREGPPQQLTLSLMGVSWVAAVTTSTFLGRGPLPPSQWQTVPIAHGHRRIDRSCHLEFITHSGITQQRPGRSPGCPCQRSSQEEAREQSQIQLEAPRSAAPPWAPVGCLTRSKPWLSHLGAGAPGLLRALAGCLQRQEAFPLFLPVGSTVPVPLGWGRLGLSPVTVRQLQVPDCCDRTLATRERGGGAAGASAREGRRGLGRDGNGCKNDLILVAASAQGVGLGTRGRGAVGAGAALPPTGGTCVLSGSQAGRQCGVVRGPGYLHKPEEGLAAKEPGTEAASKGSK